MILFDILKCWYIKLKDVRNFMKFLDVKLLLYTEQED
jgi:hypothetical protein